MGTNKACLTPHLLLINAAVVSTALSGGDPITFLIRPRSRASGSNIARTRAKKPTTSASWGMKYSNRCLESVLHRKPGEEAHRQLLPRGRLGNIHDSREEHDSANDIEVGLISPGPDFSI